MKAYGQVDGARIEAPVNLKRETQATHLRRVAGVVGRSRAQAILDDLPRDEPAVCLARLFLLDDEVSQCPHKVETYSRGRTRARRA